MTAIASVTALIVETDGTIRAGHLTVDDYWTSRAVHHGRAAVLDAVGDNVTRYYAIGDAAGIACLAVGATRQHDDREQINTLAGDIVARYGRDGSPLLRGRAVILAGWECDPQPIPDGAADDLARMILADIEAEPIRA